MFFLQICLQVHCLNACKCNDSSCSLFLWTEKGRKKISNCPKICLLLSSIETSQYLSQSASMCGQNDKTTEDSFRTSGNTFALIFFMSKKHRMAFCDRIIPPSVSITPRVPTATTIKSNTIFFCLTEKGERHNSLLTQTSTVYICHYTLPLIFSPSYLPSMLLFYHQCVFFHFF